MKQSKEKKNPNGCSKVASFSLLTERESYRMSTKGPRTLGSQFPSDFSWLSLSKACGTVKTSSEDTARFLPAHSAEQWIMNEKVVILSKLLSQVHVLFRLTCLEGTWAQQESYAWAMACSQMPVPNILCAKFSLLLSFPTSRTHNFRTTRWRDADLKQLPGHFSRTESDSSTYSPAFPSCTSEEAVRAPSPVCQEYPRKHVWSSPIQELDTVRSLFFFFFKWMVNKVSNDNGCWGQKLLHATI